jgi:hypothetical protein
MCCGAQEGNLFRHWLREGAARVRELFPLRQFDKRIRSIIIATEATQFNKFFPAYPVSALVRLLFV